MKTTTNYLFNPVIFTLLALTSLFGLAQNVTTPRAASPAAEISQTVGLTDITVNYSRPKLTTAAGVDRGGQIWGQLVPYGFNKTPFGKKGIIPWRAGANENTILSFSDPIVLEGKEVAAGSYGLHMDVQENGAVTVILSSNTSSWGSYYYDETEDVVRVQVQSKPTSKTEVLTYAFVDFGTDYTVLSLKWDEKEIPVISKIEKPQALEDLEAILEASDGVMVARGDLGVELSPEKVPMAQKRIIRMANEQYKWVITATQMLESMTDHARPTRAETSDVANAILDGTDAVMLSGETSVGRYPVGSVKMMDRIARETEKEFPSGVYTPPPGWERYSVDKVVLERIEAARKKS